MAWLSPPYNARFDFLTPLDATGFLMSQRLLRTITEPVGVFHHCRLRSARRLARGQVRLDVEFRLLSDNRLVINPHDVREWLEDLVGSAHYLQLRAGIMPLVRLYRIRLVTH